MHVGLLIYGSLDTLSGGYLYDRKLVEHLRGAGDEVEIISLPWRNYARHLADNFNGKFRRRLQSAPFDVLLQDELNHPSLFYLNRRLRGRYPLISVVHHLRCRELRPAWQNALYRAIEQRYLRSVEGFVFNSRTTRAEVSALAGAQAPSVVAHPAGDHVQSALTVEHVEARLKGLPPKAGTLRGSAPGGGGPLRLLFLGNVIPRKGLHTLVAALAQLKRADWALTVVGSLAVDPAYARGVRREIERLGLQARVRLLGALPEAEVRAHLEQSHLLAVPSSYEGFGIVYLEGMACGLPAIATTAGAAGEIITNDVDGFLAPPENPDALAKAIRSVLDDRDRLRAMSLAALERYRRHPTWAESMAAVRLFLATL